MNTIITSNNPNDVRVLQPWDQQPGEPEKAFYAFSCYISRPVLKNELTSLARELFVPYSSILRISKQFKWKERLAAFLRRNAVDRIIDQEIRQRELSEENLAITARMKELIRDKLQQMDAEDLSNTEMIKMAEFVVKTEKLELGQPTENIISKHEVSGTLEVQKTGEAGFDAQKVIMDAAASELACKLIESLSNSANQSGSVRNILQSGEVEACASPKFIESKTS